MTDHPDIHTAAEAAESEALAHLREVHIDPDTPPPPVPEAVRPESKSPAKWAYERLILYIRNFESKLDAEHEIAIGMVGGDTGVMRIEGLGFFDPDIVTFYGTDPSGARTQLIQHVSQLSVMLRALPKRREAEAPVRIGFRLAKELEGDNEDATG